MVWWESLKLKSSNPAVRQKAIDGAKPQLQAYLRAIDKAVKLIREKPAEVTDIIAKNLSVQPAEVAGQTLDIFAGRCLY